MACIDLKPDLAGGCSIGKVAGTIPLMKNDILCTVLRNWLVRNLRPHEINFRVRFANEKINDSYNRSSSYLAAYCLLFRPPLGRRGFQ
jgi:hypothetical protein